MMVEFLWLNKSSKCLYIFCWKISFWKPLEDDFLQCLLKILYALRLKLSTMENRGLIERNNYESRLIKEMLDDVLVSVQWGNWLIFLNDQNQARSVFSVLEVVFVQTGHDRCVITLIAPHTDHNLYCCSWRTLLEMFPGPRLPIINLLMTPCGVCLPGIPRIHGDTYDNEINTQQYCQSPGETDCLYLRLYPPLPIPHLPIFLPTYKNIHRI